MKTLLWPADGYAGVAFRTELGAGPVGDIPNGTRILCLGVDGEWMRVRWVVGGSQRDGWVKVRNTPVEKPWAPSQPDPATRPPRPKVPLNIQRLCPEFLPGY
eukprot:gene36338-65848_t